MASVYPCSILQKTHEVMNLNNIHIIYGMQIKSMDASVTMDTQAMIAPFGNVPGEMIL